MHGVAVGLGLTCNPAVGLAPVTGCTSNATFWKMLATPRRSRFDEEEALHDFLVYRDSAGRVIDFHALRHTFVTNLASGGVHPKTAQALARHSTITLTMDRYSHSYRGDEAKALDALPDLSVRPSEAVAATGTDNAEPPSKNWAQNWARKVRSGAISGDSERQSIPSNRDHERNEKPLKTRGFRGDSNGEGGIRTHGEHEVHTGFRDRPVQPLRHLSSQRSKPDHKPHYAMGQSGQPGGRAAAGVR